MAEDEVWYGADGKVAAVRKKEPEKAVFKPAWERRKGGKAVKRKRWYRPSRAGYWPRYHVYPRRVYRAYPRYYHGGCYRYSVRRGGHFSLYLRR